MGRGRGRSSGRGGGRGRGGHRGGGTQRGKGQGIVKQGHHANLSKAKQEAILNYMKQHSGNQHSAIEIARGCGYQTTRDVNPTVYHFKRKNILIQENGTPSLWSLGSNFAKHERETTTPVATQMLSDMSSMGLGNSQTNFMGTGSDEGNMGFGMNSQMNDSGYGNRMQTNLFGIGNNPQTSSIEIGDNSQRNLSENTDTFSQSMSADGTVDPKADVKEELAEEGLDEDVDEEMEFDINDRINDLMASTRSNVFDVSAPSPERVDSQCESQEDETLDLWGPIPESTDVTLIRNLNIQPKLEPKHSATVSMTDEKFEEPQNLEFKDQVLKTLAQRPLKTGASFIIVNALKSNKEDVEKVLRECEQEKLVSSAWTITRKGDTYLEEKKIYGSSLKIEKVRHGDKNF